MLNAAAQQKSTDGSLTVSSALRIAWVTWIGLLIIPFLVSLYLMWQYADDGVKVSSTDAGQVWFLVSFLYLLAVVPLSFFWRSHLFRSYYEDRPVQPHLYLLGMIAVWMSLEVGGVFSLAGCLVYKSLFPNIIPAIVAFVFFVTFWPAGRAMTRATGASQDPEVYQTPR